MFLVFGEDLFVAALLAQIDLGGKDHKVGTSLRINKRKDYEGISGFDPPAAAKALEPSFKSRRPNTFLKSNQKKFVVLGRTLALIINLRQRLP